MNKKKEHKIQNEGGLSNLNNNIYNNSININQSIHWEVRKVKLRFTKNKISILSRGRTVDNKKYEGRSIQIYYLIN
jgi:hypothetical protein